MSLFTPGRVVLKIAGRDAGRMGVVVEELDTPFVLVDGNVRRKKVNVKHLEPLPQSLELSAGASHEEVAALFKKEGLPVWETKAKTVGERPRQKRKGKNLSVQKTATAKEKILEKDNVKKVKKAKKAVESKVSS